MRARDWCVVAVLCVLGVALELAAIWFAMTAASFGRALGAVVVANVGAFALLASAYELDFRRWRCERGFSL